MENQATIVIDLGFGDAGKGSIIDYLSRRWPSIPKMIVRFHGGSQAAHNVVTPDGKHHTFSQVGSGSFVNGVETYLSEYMAVDPLALRKEIKALQSIGVEPMVYVDEEALIITPFHKIANMIRERQRGLKRHGSCGVGFGEAVSDSLQGTALRVRDLAHLDISIEKLKKIFDLKMMEFNFSKDMGDFIYNSMAHDLQSGIFNFCRVVNCEQAISLLSEKDLIFEGAQGILLDEWYGFHPYTTWSTCTPKNALLILEKTNFSGKVEVIGVIRSYMVRHGPGPLPSESNISSTCPKLDKFNFWNPWQGDLRMGHFDIPLLRYSLSICGRVDYLAVTCCDQLEEEAEICTSYRDESFLNPKVGLLDLAYRATLTKKLTSLRKRDLHLETFSRKEFLASIESLLETQIGIISAGPTAANKLSRKG